MLMDVLGCFLTMAAAQAPLTLTTRAPTGPVEKSTTVSVGKIALSVDNETMRTLLEACGRLKRSAPGAGAWQRPHRRSARQASIAAAACTLASCPGPCRRRAYGCAAAAAAPLSKSLGVRRVPLLSAQLEARRGPRDQGPQGLWLRRVRGRRGRAARHPPAQRHQGAARHASCVPAAALCRAAAGTARQLLSSSASCLSRGGLCCASCRGRGPWLRGCQRECSPFPRRTPNCIASGGRAGAGDQGQQRHPAVRGAVRGRQGRRAGKGGAGAAGGGAQAAGGGRGGGGGRRGGRGGQERRGAGGGQPRARGEARGGRVREGRQGGQQSV